MIRDFELKQLIRVKLVFIELLKHLENHFHLYSNDHLQKNMLENFVISLSETNCSKIRLISYWSCFVLIQTVNLRSLFV